MCLVNYTFNSVGWPAMDLIRPRGAACGLIHASSLAGRPDGHSAPVETVSDSQ